MTDLAFKTSSDFRISFFPDTLLGNDSLDGIEESLGCMKLLSCTGSPDTTVAKSLNTLWQDMMKDGMQIFDDIDRPGKNPAMTVPGNPRPDMNRNIHSVSSNRTYYFVFSSANKTVCVNRTEQNRTEISFRPRRNLDGLSLRGSGSETRIYSHLGMEILFSLPGFLF